MGMRSYSRPIGKLVDLRKKLSLSSTALFVLPFLLYLIYTGIEINFSFKFNLLNHKSKDHNNAPREGIADLTEKYTVRSSKTDNNEPTYIPKGADDPSLSGSSLFCPYLIQNPVANYKACYRSADNFTCMAGPQEGKPIFIHLAALMKSLVFVPSSNDCTLVGFVKFYHVLRYNTILGQHILA